MSSLSIFFLLSFVVFAVAAGVDPCVEPAGTCASLGGTCGPKAYCQYGYFCNTTTSKCVQLSTTGASCSDDEQCPLRSCINGKCTSNVLEPGSPCTSNSQCYFVLNGVDAPSTCKNGRCVGLAAGGNCSDDKADNCEYSTYCTDGICKSFQAVGSNCTDDYPDPCGPNANCFEHVCVAHFSRSQTQTCESTLECQKGLVCANSTCTTPASTSSLTPCGSGKTDCSSLEECIIDCHLSHFQICYAKQPFSNYNPDTDDFFRCIGNYADVCTPAAFSTSCPCDVCKIGLILHALGSAPYCAFSPILTNLINQCSSGSPNPTNPPNTTPKPTTSPSNSTINPTTKPSNSTINPTTKPPNSTTTNSPTPKPVNSTSSSSILTSSILIAVLFLLLLF